MMTVFRLVLLVGLVLCAIATALVKKPMQAVIIYMAYSVMMSVVWILLQSPDLAITEAAVGAVALVIVECFPGQLIGKSVHVHAAVHGARGALRCWLCAAAACVFRS